MAKSYVPVCVLCLGVFIKSSMAEISNDIDVPMRGSLPKPVSYFTFPPADEATHNSEKPQGARFSYPGVTNLEGYGPNVLSQAYYPFKFDLGGLLLGTVVGVGTLLLIPKIMHLLVPELAAYGHTYGPYARNVDFVPQGAHQIVLQFEKVLTENNINSSECLQKAICSYVQSSIPKTNRARSADANDINDKSISDYFVGFLIDGSKFKMAVENGKQDVSCSVLYPKCPFNQNSVAAAIKQLILNNSTFSDHHQDSE